MIRWKSDWIFTVYSSGSLRKKQPSIANHQFPTDFFAQPLTAKQHALLQSGKAARKHHLFRSPERASFLRRQCTAKENLNEAD